MYVSGIPIGEKILEGFWKEVLFCLVLLQYQLTFFVGKRILYFFGIGLLHEPPTHWPTERNSAKN